MSGGIVSTLLVGLTDVGLVRGNNEDMFLMVEPESGMLLDNNYKLIRPLEKHNILLVVSDGMGGYEGGEVASLLTVGAIKNELLKLPKQLSPQSRLEAAVEEANRTVSYHRNLDPKLSNMGATATAVLIEQDIAYVAEVGDSRAYILRDGRIKQLTTDQTMIQMLIDSGAISPESASTNKNRNILLQAIGSQEFLQIAVTSIKLQINDILLLCSDGLTGKVNANEIKKVIDSSATLLDAGNTLINLAKERGGDDNITIILAKFEGSGLQTKLNAGGMAATLTKQIKVLARFDPEQEAEAKPRREVRPANFQDWVASAVIDAFARSDEQREALAAIGKFGDYVVFRKGDVLHVEPGSSAKEHYWLVGGRYRVMADNQRGEKQSLFFLVPPTDRRSDDLIQAGEAFVWVRRQFFISNLTMLQQQARNPIIRCEDDKNIAIHIPGDIFDQLSEILGDRFVSTVRHS
ncbi:MAG: serine/threonine-protein phosphatase [Blastocatellia bacterium]|nr:serine/threonine-protein phosphatase [Blastocatellia bacterium]MBL8193945.1 serine/threonine-protein phosphatase [Blastocatellia bacterium]MBN8723988.1 serine/threonine-protein phosphatase [Acidobacteriota bacterium]